MICTKWKILHHDSRLLRGLIKSLTCRNKNWYSTSCQGKQWYYIFELCICWTDYSIHMMWDVKSVFELWNCSTVHTFIHLPKFKDLYMANTFEIMFKCPFSCIPVTHPVLKDHISHMTRKTEVTLQHKDKSCGLDGLKMKNWMESNHDTSRAHDRKIDCWIHKD